MNIWELGFPSDTEGPLACKVQKAKLGSDTEIVREREMREREIRREGNWLQVLRKQLKI